MKTLKLLIILTVWLQYDTTSAQSVSDFTFSPTCEPVISITTLTNSVDCFSLSTTPLDANDPDSYYTWDFGDGTVNESGKTLYHCYTSETVPGNTTRTLTLTYTNPGLNCIGVSSTTLNVQVIAPVPCANVPPDILISALTVTVWAGSFIPEVFSSYDFGDGSPVSYNSIHTYTACGQYIIHTRVWDMNTPSQVCHLYVAANISCSVPTGIKETEREAAFIFPNPASGLLFIATHESINRVMVNDILGKSVLETSLKGKEPVLSITDLPSGSYFMTIFLDSGSQKTFRFIKN